MDVFITHHEKETSDLADNMAKHVKTGDVLCLSGNLGAGKSVFARGFIQSLTFANCDVPSPTFTLVQTYETSKGPLWHFDLYRLEDPEEIYELGWEDAINTGILLVEWSERLGHLLPARRTDIVFETCEYDTRNIKVYHHG